MTPCFIGLITLSGTATFDRFDVRTNDTAFGTAGGLLAETAGSGTAASITDGAAIDALLDQAVAVWKATGRIDDEQLAALDSVNVEIIQLDGRHIGRFENGTVYIDVG